MKIVWHYTTVENFETILGEKRLRPLKFQRTLEIRPPIWFSKQKFWDPTFAKMVHKRNKLNHLQSWESYRLSGLGQFFQLMAKETAGIKAGTRTSDWYCSLKSVPIVDWIKIEKFDGEKREAIKDKKPSLRNPSVQTHSK